VGETAETARRVEEAKRAAPLTLAIGNRRRFVECPGAQTRSSTRTRDRSSASPRRRASPHDAWLPPLSDRRAGGSSAAGGDAARELLEHCALRSRQKIEQGDAGRWGRIAQIGASSTESVIPISRPRHQLPIALEGAIKLKELSYIHAEGYPAGEI